MTKKIKLTKQQRAEIRRAKNPVSPSWKPKSRKEQKLELTNYNILPVARGSRPLKSAQIRKAFKNELDISHYKGPGATPRPPGRPPTKSPRSSPVNSNPARSGSPVPVSSSQRPQSNKPSDGT